MLLFIIFCGWLWVCGFLGVIDRWVGVSKLWVFYVIMLNRKGGVL